MIDIQLFLPHRAPFLCVDSIEQITDESVTTSFAIEEESLFVKDGYFTETGLIENAAQTCSAIVGKSYIDQDLNTKLIGFISSIKKVQLTKLAAVNSTITTKAFQQSRLDFPQYSIASMQCRIFDENECELLFCELNLLIQKSI